LTGCKIIVSYLIVLLAKYLQYICDYSLKGENYNFHSNENSYVKKQRQARHPCSSLATNICCAANHLLLLGGISDILLIFTRQRYLIVLCSICWPSGVDYWLEPKLNGAVPETLLVYSESVVTIVVTVFL